MQCPRMARKSVFPQVLQLLRIQIEHCSLVVRFRGRKVQRVANAQIQIETRSHFPIVLNKPFLKPSARLQDFLLDVDRKLLHLAQQKTCKREACSRDPIRVRKESAECEQTGGRRRLNYVQPRSAVVDAELERMTALCERSGVGNFRDIRPERGCHVGWRTQLLKSGNRECGQLIFKCAVRWNSGDAEVVGRSARMEQRRAVY